MAARTPPVSERERDCADGERTGAAAAPADPGTLATYDRIRNEIIFEHGLLGQRVQWLVMSQAFLFVPLVVGIRGDGGFAASLFYPVLPWLGLAVCVTTWLAILAAIIRINDWKRKQYAVQRHLPEAYRLTLRPRFGVPLPRFVLPLLGYMPPFLLPLFLVATWLCVLGWWCPVGTMPH